jgi:succinate dehydrogenase / fumarate reductase membrane anchor subunit
MKYTAHYGINSWLIQKVTGAVISIFAILAIDLLICCKFSRYTMMYNPWVIVSFKVSALIIKISLVAHLWVHMRDVWMDYIKSNSVRLFLHTITAFYLLVNFII